MTMAGGVWIWDGGCRVVVIEDRILTIGRCATYEKVIPGRGL